MLIALKCSEPYVIQERNLQVQPLKVVFLSENMRWQTGGTLAEIRIFAKRHHEWSIYQCYLKTPRLIVRKSQIINDPYLLGYWGFLRPKCNTNVFF